MRRAGCTLAALAEVSLHARHAPLKAFVEENHYAGTWPATRFAFGLHAPGRTAPAGAGGATVLDAVEYLARDLGRTDVVRWIAAQRAELDRAGGGR